MKNTAVILCLFISGFAYSSDESFNWLTSASGQKSALSGSCDYIENSKSMVCNMRQIMVSKALSEEDAQKELSATIDEVDTELKSKSLVKYVDEMLGEVCPKLSEQKGNIKDKTSQAMFEQLEGVCDSPSREKIIALLSSTINKRKQTCKVYDTDTGSYLFKPVNENKWVSNNGPSGDCGSVIVMTLERKPEHQTLWNYTQVRHYTNTTSSMCKSLSEMNTPMSYSWNGKPSIQMDCKFIDFGL